MTTGRIGVGFIGTGNISSAYLRAITGQENMAGFPVLDIKGLADMRPEASEARAAEFGLKSMSIDEMLASSDIQLIVNLTIPRAHVDVGLRALAAGKHVYSEKPLGINFAEGRKLLDAANKAGLRIGSAPDTFLGGSHQQARAVVDSGALGQLIGGTGFFMCPGHESWHPDPAFYYDIGGGPVLDMGPYYITDLVNLLGPVARVSAMASRLRSQRTVLSEPKKGQVMDVKVDTHATASLGFANGAIARHLSLPANQRHLLAADRGIRDDDVALLAATDHHAVRLQVEAQDLLATTEENQLWHRRPPVLGPGRGRRLLREQKPR